MEVREFCVSYTARNFQRTCEFYERTLGFTYVTGWDRPADGRGAYFLAGGTGMVEIFDEATGKAFIPPPPRDSFMVVIAVDDAASYMSRIEAAGGTIDWPMTNESYGRYFGVRDPNDVAIYFMERRGEAARP